MATRQAESKAGRVAPDREPEPGNGEARARPAVPIANPFLAAGLALLVPGAGHVFLRRWVRGVAFFVLVLAALLIGLFLHGRLYQPVPGQPLSYLGTVGAMGTGACYGLLRFVLGYEGAVASAGYEYGTAFVITAGLMNLLLVLDAWDIARGEKG